MLVAYLPVFDDRPPAGFSDAAPPPVDAAALVAEAEARGYQAGLAAAAVRQEAERTEERARQAAAAAEARARWTAEEADRLAGLVTAALDAVHERLSGDLAVALAPVLMEAVRRRAVDELAATVRSLFEDQGGCLFTIAGPADLLEALKSRLDGQATSIEYRIAATPDITVKMNETVIETQIGAWAARLDSTLS